MAKKDLQTLLKEFSISVKESNTEEVSAIAEVSEQFYMDGFYLLNLIQVDEQQNVITRSKAVVGKDVALKVTERIKELGVESLDGATISITGKAMFSPSQDFSIFVSSLEVVSIEGANKTSVANILANLKDKGEFSLNKELPDSTTPKSINILFHSSENNVSACKGTKELLEALTDIDVTLYPLNFKKPKGGLEDDCISALKAIHDNGRGEDDIIVIYAPSVELVEAVNFNKPKVARSFARIGKRVVSIVGGKHSLAVAEFAHSSKPDMIELIKELVGVEQVSLSEHVVNSIVFEQTCQNAIERKYKSAIVRLFTEILSSAKSDQVEQVATAKLKDSLLTLSPANDVSVTESFKNTLNLIKTELQELIHTDSLVSVEGKGDDNSVKITPDGIKSTAQESTSLIKAELMSLLQDEVSFVAPIKEHSSSLIMERNFTHDALKATLTKVREALIEESHNEQNMSRNLAGGRLIAVNDLDKEVRGLMQSTALVLSKSLQDINALECEQVCANATEHKTCLEHSIAKNELIYKMTKQAIRLPEGEVRVQSMEGNPVEVRDLTKGDECIITKDGMSSRFVVIDQIRKTKK